MRKRLLAFVMALALCLSLMATAAAFDGGTAGSENIVSASVSTALVDANGDLWMWGQNYAGQLGNHTEEDSKGVYIGWLG